MAKTLTWNKAYQKEVLSYLQRLKVERGCAKCTWKDDHYGLCFHHIHKDTATFSLSDKAHHGILEVFTELGKCIVLCDRCRAVALGRKIDLSQIPTIQDVMNDLVDTYVRFDGIKKHKGSFRGPNRPKADRVDQRGGEADRVDQPRPPPEVNESTTVLVDGEEDLGGEADEIRTIS
jgi:hypothetical protein